MRRFATTAMTVTTAPSGIKTHQMATFTIDSENDIAAPRFRSTVDNLQSVTSEKELAKLAAEWPGSGLAEAWNSFAGMAPFSDLKQEVHGSQVARRTDLGSDPAFVGMDYCRRDAVYGRLRRSHAPVPQLASAGPLPALLSLSLNVDVRIETIHSRESHLIPESTPNRTQEP